MDQHFWQELTRTDNSVVPVLSLSLSLSLSAQMNVPQPSAYGQYGMYTVCLKSKSRSPALLPKISIVSVQYIVPVHIVLLVCLFIY